MLREFLEQHLNQIDQRFELLIRMDQQFVVVVVDFVV
jgi:hypothetical protein